MFNKKSNLERIQLINLLIDYVKEQQDLMIDQKSAVSAETYKQFNDSLWQRMKQLISKRNEIYHQALSEIESI